MTCSTSLRILGFILRTVKNFRHTLVLIIRFVYSALFRNRFDSIEGSEEISEIYCPGPNPLVFLLGMIEMNHIQVRRDVQIDCFISRSATIQWSMVMPMGIVIFLLNRITSDIEQEV